MNASTMEAVLTAASGGLLAIVSKYVVDRFTESHKATLALKAKRKERYFEKQLGVIAGMHELFADLATDLNELTAEEFISEDATELPSLTGSIGALRAKHADLKAFFRRNRLYLPDPLALSVEHFLLSSAVVLWIHALDKDGTEVGQHYHPGKRLVLRKEGEVIWELLTELEQAFRKLVEAD